MKTTSTLTVTTIDPYLNYDDSFIYDDSKYHKNHDYFTDYSFKEFTDRFYPILELSRQVYDISAFINLFVNLPHLFILTRKELRSNLVYIVMIGICLCDLIHSIGKIAQIFMAWQIVYSNEGCFGAFPYYHVMIDIYAKCSQIMSRRCSGFLALFIAGFRAFSVIFPMSNAVNFLMKAKSGYLIVLLCMLVCAGWSSLYYFTTIVLNEKTCPVGWRPSWKMYRQDTSGEKETRLRMYDGFIVLTICVLYGLVAIALMVALRQANIRRKNLKSDKSTHTLLLVGLMAFFMFMTESVYGAIFLYSYRVLRQFFEQGFFEDLFEVVALILSVVNSIAYCFICFFMSSQYRDVVKGLVCCGTKEETKMKKLIYSVIHHFYYASCIVQFIFLMEVIALILVITLIHNFVLIIQISLFVLIPTFYGVNFLIASVEHILYSVFAIQYFFINFLPSFAKYVTLSSRGYSRLIKLLYLILVLLQLGSHGSLLFIVISSNFEEYGVSTFEILTICLRILTDFPPEFYYGINAIFIFSACLYIPIIIKTKKMSGSQSVNQTQPERYVFYHTSVLMFFKLLYIPSVMLLNVGEDQIKEDSIFVGMNTIDFFTSHFIIQISYLFHKKQKLALCGYNKYAAVEPRVALHELP